MGDNRKDRHVNQPWVEEEEKLSAFRKPHLQNG